MATRTRRALRALLALSALIAVAGCPAVYPEFATRIRAPAPGQQLDPPPPEDLRWIRVLAARIPERTRDGRAWDQGEGNLPDPYARVLVNGREILRTKAQPDTLEPTWPDGPGGNFRVGPDDRLRVELWESNPVNDEPIGIREIGRPTSEHRATGQIRVEIEGGGSVTLAFEPAHAKVGLGLWYELRTSSVYISRTLQGGPADRAGVRKGDQVLKIGGREVQAMSPGEIRSAFNVVPRGGLALNVKHQDGAIEAVTVAEGPIYPTFEHFGPIE